MPVSHELQNLISDVSTAIVARASWGRAELEQLRRTLTELNRDVAQAERSHGTERHALTTLIDGVKAGAADIAGLARRADAVVLAGQEAGR